MLALADWLDEAMLNPHYVGETHVVSAQAACAASALMDLPIVERAALLGIVLTEQVRTNDDGFAFHTTGSGRHGTDVQRRSGGRSASQTRWYSTPPEHIPGFTYGDSPTSPAVSDV